MPASPIELTPTILTDGIVFPESLRWRDGKLWFSDIYGRRVMTVDMEGNLSEVVKMPERPTGLGFLPDGRLLINTRGDQKTHRLDPDGLHLYADMSRMLGARLDDMVVDSKGRAYVNRRHKTPSDGRAQPTGYLALITPDGQKQMVAEGIEHPNGMAITPDGKTLIVAESSGNRLTAFDIESDGLLSNQRVWANLGERAADGICLDAEMGIWIGSTWKDGFVRVLEGGEITHRIRTPGKWAIMPMLGGEDGKTLFLGTVQTTLADCRLYESAGAEQARCEGWIEYVRVDVPHAGLP